MAGNPQDPHQPVRGMIPRRLARWTTRPRAGRPLIRSGVVEAMIGFLWTAACPMAAAEFHWQPVTVDGRDHVSASAVSAFYRFDHTAEQGRVVQFRSPTLAMRWEADTNVLIVNGTKFILSAPIVRHEGTLMVSRSDLVKWIDPLLRPTHVREAEDFDTVVIDPGHGGLDNGTRGHHGDEKSFTLDLGLRLRDALTRRGFWVLMTRQSDVAVAKGIRGELASAVGRSVLVSLHFNQNPSALVHGLETYAMTPVGMASSNDSRPGLEAALGFNGNLMENASLALAAAVHSQILHRCAPADRGVRRARFAVLKDASRAAILVEGGYLSNPAEMARINQPAYRNALAAAIAEGITHYRDAMPAASGEQKGR